MAGTTKLDAVNVCLKGIGIAPVEVIDEEDADVVLAENTIDQVSRDIQSRGWFFNREFSWKITPDAGTGFVFVPNAATSMVTSGYSRDDNDLSMRGSKIYDLTNHTYDLTDRVNCENVIEFTFIMHLDYEELPPHARHAIMYIARRMFAQDLEVDQARWKFQKVDEEASFNLLLKEDAKNNKRNYIRNNGTVQSFLANAGGPNSALTYNPYFPKRNV